jgi:chromosome segregation ATPase
MLTDWTETILPHIAEIIGIAVGLIIAISGWLVAVGNSRKAKAEAGKAGAEAAKIVLDEQRERVDGLRADVEYAERRNSDLEARLRLALERLDKNEEVLRTTKSELAEAAAHQINSATRIAQLESDLKSLRTEISELRKTSAERIAELVAENTLLRKELADLRQQYTAAQVEIGELQKTIQAMKGSTTMSETKTVTAPNI